MIDPGEGPEEAIRREIEEEVGYRVHLLVPIATFYVSPGGTSERIFLYYYAQSDLLQAFKAGQIQDAKTLIALQWLQLQGKL